MAIAFPAGLTGIDKSEMDIQPSVPITEAGSILQNNGMVTLTKENLLVSVFQKINIPTSLES